MPRSIRSIQDRLRHGSGPDPQLDQDIWVLVYGQTATVSVAQARRLFGRFFRRFNPTPNLTGSTDAAIKLVECIAPSRTISILIRAISNLSIGPYSEGQLKDLAREILIILLERCESNG